MMSGSSNLLQEELQGNPQSPNKKQTAEASQNLLLHCPTELTKMESIFALKASQVPALTLRRALPERQWPFK